MSVPYSVAQPQPQNTSFVEKVDFKATGAADAFCRSLKQTGFAVLENTPIEKSLIDDVLANWQRFFRDTPVDQKMSYLHGKQTQTGYFPFKAENAKDQGTADLKEFFHLYNYTDIPAGHLPEPLKTAQLIFEMKNLGLRLLGYIAEDINDPSVLQTAIEGNQTLFRTIYYPALQPGQEAQGVRAAAHEDINLITVLPAASDAGLEVKDAQGNWHEVNYQEGDIIINVGDMLQMLTDKEYISTTHRVQNPADLTRDRVSMPMFIHPDPSYNLGPMTSAQYLDQRLKEIGLK